MQIPCKIRLLHYEGAARPCKRCAQHRRRRTIRILFAPRNTPLLRKFLADIAACPYYARMVKTLARSFRLVCSPAQTPLVEELLRAQGYDFAPEPFSPFCRRLLHEPCPLGASLAAFFGYIYIQDRSSMLPPLALAPGRGGAVLDMCASPGSKTGFLAQLVGETGFVLGNEPSPPRLGTLRANLHRMNLLQAGTCSYSGDALPLRPASWDAILLDPPCSGWGTAEKHPQVLKLWKGDKIAGLTGLQRHLLRRACALLRPGGRLAYSTCTTNADENEAQVRFAEEELGLERVPLTPFPGFAWEELPGGEGTLRVDGARSQAQGFYVALLRKPEDAPLPAEDDEALLSAQRTGHKGDSRKGNPRPAGRALALSCLAGPACDPALLPPGQAALFGQHVRFVPQAAAALLPPSFIWQGALLGGFSGGAPDMAPRLRALLPQAGQEARSARLDLDDLKDVTALLSGQSLQTGLAGREAGLWWRGLPLGRVTLKQGRAVARFK